MQQNEDEGLQDSVAVNLQDSEADMQQNEDEGLQDSFIVNLHNSEADPENVDEILQDSVFIDVPKIEIHKPDNDAPARLNLKNNDEKRKINLKNNEEAKTESERKTVGIAFPSTDLKNVRNGTVYYQIDLT